MASPLTDAAIRRLPPVTAPVLLPVGGSLYLKRRPNGRQSWVLRTRIGGKWQIRQLGDWPTVPMHLARKRAEAERKDSAPADAGSTVAHALAEFKLGYIGVRYRREDSKKEAGAMLGRALAAVAGRAMVSLRRADLVLAIDRVRDRPNTATKTLALLKQFTSWAAARDLIEADPMSGVRASKLGLKAYAPRERTLTAAELRELWKRTDSDAHVLKFCALTACRIGEALQWTPEQMAGDVWTCPDTKNGTAHTLPLPKAALALLPLPDPRPPYGSLHSRMKTAGIPWRPHDVRRTAATLMRATGVPVLDIEAVLNHAPPRLVRVYQRHDPLDEKRAALEQLAAAVDRLLAGKGVGHGSAEQ
jgi:integrase